MSTATTAAGPHGQPERRFVVRAAAPADAAAIHALITANLEHGRLLPRRRDEVALHAHRFVVATSPHADGPIVACAELAPLGDTLAEVRSLVVDIRARSAGIGRAVVAELMRRAADAGFRRLVAFTHAAEYFARMGFSTAPHTWFPEKIDTDCCQCAQFRRCGQAAVMMPLPEPIGPASRTDIHV